MKGECIEIAACYDSAFHIIQQPCEDARLFHSVFDIECLQMDVEDEGTKIYKKVVLILSRNAT